MAKKAKVTRGRKKKRIPSIVYRLTFSLDPIAHAAIIALLESIPQRKRSQYVLDMLMGKVSISVGVPQPAQITTEVPAEREVEIAGDGW